MEPTHWVVIGAGPCGIGSVGSLLDRGMRVTWIDPSFSVGRMGQFYRNVPSNTLNGDLIRGFELSPSLDFVASQKVLIGNGKTAMSDLPSKVCFDLGVFVDTVEVVLATLKTKTENVVGVIDEIKRNNACNDSWTVHASTKTGQVEIKCDAVLVCCGASPSHLPSLRPPPHAADQPFVQLDEHLCLHNLDFMVDPVHVKELNQRDLSHFPMDPPYQQQVWGVVGNSHSAMLVVKNLFESGVQSIVNVFRSELKYMHQTAEGWVRYQGVGLKGSVGEWARAVYEGSDAIKKVRIDANAATDMRALLRVHGVTHCVVAVGYGRDLGGLRVTIGGDSGVTLSEEDWDHYNRMTGEIPLPVAVAEAPENSSTQRCMGLSKSQYLPSISQSPASHPAPRCSGLFGGGIAFPQYVVDGGGNTEPWVGFKRSVEQVDLMVVAMARK